MMMKPPIKHGACDPKVLLLPSSKVRVGLDQWRGRQGRFCGQSPCPEKRPFL